MTSYITTSRSYSHGDVRAKNVSGVFFFFLFSLSQVIWNTLLWTFQSITKFPAVFFLSNLEVHQATQAENMTKIGQGQCEIKVVWEKRFFFPESFAIRTNFVNEGYDFFCSRRRCTWNNSDWLNATCPNNTVVFWIITINYHHKPVTYQVVITANLSIFCFRPIKKKW